MKKLFVVAAAIFAVFASSCGAEKSAVVKKSLKNGVPVYCKRDAGSHFFNAVIAVKSRTMDAPQDYFLFENMIFALMPRGSEKYSDDEIKRVCYEKNASLGGSAGLAFSEMSLSCLEYYADDLLPLLADCFLHPRFDEDEFEKAALEVEAALQYAKNSPVHQISYAMQDFIYKGHPLDRSAERGDDFPQILREGGVAKLRQLHGEVLNASRISLVLTGNFDEKKIFDFFNATLGELRPQERDERTIPPARVFDAESAGRIAHFGGCESAQDTSYILKITPAPAPFSKESLALGLAEEIFSDTLYNIVREKNGSCYSIYAGDTGGLAPITTRFAYMAGSPNDIPRGFDEADEVMRSGRVITGKNADGDFIFEDVGAALEGYKNSQINQIFDGLKTSAGQASAIASSLHLCGDPDYFFTLEPKIRAVAASDIAAAVEASFFSDEHSWLIVAGDGLKDAIDTSLFK